MAATGRTKAAAGVRVKLLPHGFSIDHPDSELGEQLMADALGVADRDAMHGILRQLVKASVNGQRPDEVNLAFMISMVKSIKPRDSVEAMLVAQMVSVHVMAMRCAYHLANAEDIARQDSAGRALLWVKADPKRRTFDVRFSVNSGPSSTQRSPPLCATSNDIL